MKRLILIVVIVLFGFNSYASNLVEGTLKNGLAYRIFKKSNIPIISVNIKIKAGSVFDSNGKFGEAYVVANSLENCDSPKYKAERLRFLFDKYGVESSVSVNKGYITISATASNGNITPLFCLLNEILHSKFDIKGIEFVKRDTINSIKALENDKDYLAIHSAFVSLIGNKSYSHTSLGTLKGVKNLKRRDIVDFFKKYFRAKNMVISVSGNGFSSNTIIQNIRYYFSSLNGGYQVSFPKLKFNYGLHIKDIIRPQTKQSYIYFAFPSFDYGTREYYSAKLLAFILGGNLNSYLTKDIRTKHGYAYSVFSFVYRLPKKSLFVIGLQTQNKFTLNAIEEVFKDIKNYNAYITKKNLSLVKSYIEGSIPIGLQLPQSIANSLSDGYFSKIKGLPWQYNLKKINEVSIEDLKKAAKKLFSSNVSIGIVSFKDFSKKIKSIAESYGYRQSY